MKHPDSKTGPTRRIFLSRSVMGTAASFAAPLFVPRTYLFGSQVPPSRKIQVAQIGCGRMGMSDLRDTMKHDLCRIVAVCDLDSKRLEAARGEVEQNYKGLGESRVDVNTYSDYRELLARPEIDAVIVSPPDHWHALVAVEAILAGKDVFVQKPMTYDIAEAIALRTAVRARNRVLQTGSQQRSSKPWNTFRVASEAARNGRIGKIHTIRVGIGQDQPMGKPPMAQPVPSNLNYEKWLGPAPEQPYMEARVHPQTGYGRPGWITTEDFGLGMITNWGAHHMDIAQWGMSQELSGPSRIQASASFMTGDVWTVHHTYHVEMMYDNGVRLVIDDGYPNGVRFEGADGWVFCARTAERVTSSDPIAAAAQDRRSLDASHPSVLTDVRPGDVRWAPSEEHHRDWLESILSRKDPIAPVDQAARSLEACATAWIGMKLGRTLNWDPLTERFKNDAEANAMRSRKARSAAFDLSAVMARAGLVASDSTYSKAAPAAGALG
ncbi:MAG: Gfo/Idh/MocA family oxidoreductase [Vicinamibacteria bacterium]